MYFSAAASSEKDHGSMNLDSNTASVPSTIPSRVATIHAIAECLTRRCTSRTRRPVLRSYQERLSSSVAEPSCTMRLPDRSSGSALAPFLPPEADQGGFIAPHNDPGVRTADEGPAAFIRFCPQMGSHDLLKQACVKRSDHLRIA